jgi:hypothetical protein
MSNMVSKTIIDSIGGAAGAGIAEPFQRSSISDEQPTVADLILPGTGYRLSDEFACLLKVLGGESA